MSIPSENAHALSLSLLVVNSVVHIMQRVVDIYSKYGGSMRKMKFLIAGVFLLGIITPLIVNDIAVAQTAGGSASVGQVETFIKNVIKVIAGLSGLVATGFFVLGGFTYITSSGNPEKLHKAKQTLLWSGIGLAIVIAAFALSTIVTEIATNAFGN